MRGELQTTTRNEPTSFEVAGEYLHTTSPLVLPSHRCVKCGSAEPGGTFRRDMVNYVNPFIWLTLLISGLLTIIVYLVARKQIDVAYYLCPRCADRRKIGQVTTSLVSMVSIVGLVVGMLSGGLELTGMFAAALIISWLGRILVVRPPLRAVSHDQGYFSLKGASPEFTASLHRRRLE